MSDRRLGRRKLLVGTGSLIAAGLAGCSSPENPTSGTGNGDDDDGDDPTDTPTPDGDATVVNVAANRFNPQIVQIEQGETLRWSHIGGTHTITFYHRDNDRQHRCPEGSTAVQQNMNDGVGSYEVTLDIPGVYDYFCEFHEESNQMLGSIVVGEPTSADQPGLSEPSADLGPFASQEVKNLNSGVREMLDL